MESYILEYPETTALYCVTILISFAFAFVATKAKKHQLLFVILGALVFILISGLRASSVGSDTQGYIDTFEALRSAMHWRVISITEPGFLMVARFLMIVTESPQACLFFFSLATNAFIILRFWELRDKISFPLIIVVYACVLFFPVSLSGIRQFMAVALIFWGMRYLERKKYLVFSLIVLLAASFHYSAVVAFVLLLFEAMIYKPAKQNDIIVTLRSVIILFSPIILLIIGYVIGMGEEFSGYGRWLFDATNVKPEAIGTMLLFWFLLISAYCIDYLLGRKGLDTNERSMRTRIAFCACLFFLLYWVVGVLYPVASRIGWYFWPTTLILFTQGYCSSQFRQVQILLALLKIVIVFYSFYAVIAYGGNGQIPYLPFWVI